MTTVDTTPDRPPRMHGWVRLYATIGTNPKIQATTDAEFRTWTLALALSGGEQVRGRFLDRTYLAAAVGRRLAKHIPRLLELGLLEEHPDGMVGPHAFDYWQPTDERSRERGARWRENNKREAAGRPRVYADGRETRTPPSPRALRTASESVARDANNAWATPRRDETRAEQTRRDETPRADSDVEPRVVREPVSCAVCQRPINGFEGKLILGTRPIQWQHKDCPIT